MTSLFLCAPPATGEEDVTGIGTRGRDWHPAVSEPGHRLDGSPGPEPGRSSNRESRAVLWPFWSSRYAPREVSPGSVPRDRNGACPFEGKAPPP